MERKGQRKHRAYNVWSSMLKRCYNQNCKSYPNYGGRGIYVCDVWRYSSIAFLLWADTSGYSPKLQLDRIDNDGPYSPENCRWVTRKVNINNTRHNRKVTAFGETKNMHEWAEDERCVVTGGVLRYRIEAGCPSELALTQPAFRPGGNNKGKGHWWETK